MKNKLSNRKNVLEMAKYGAIRNLILFSISLLCSCKTNHDLTGNWKSGGYSLLDKVHVILLRGGILQGCELKLNSDSSWTWTGTCEVFEGNKWAIQNDSLILFPDTCWGIRNSTLNRGREEFRKINIGFKIRGKCLERQLAVYGRHRAFIDSSSQYKTFIIDKLEHIK